MDPVEDIAALALKNNLLCHVDCCLGSFLLPALRKLHIEGIPAFDFSVKGVTSISCDPHKARISGPFLRTSMLAGSLVRIHPERLFDRHVLVSDFAPLSILRSHGMARRNLSISLRCGQSAWLFGGGCLGHHYGHR